LEQDLHLGIRAIALTGGSTLLYRSREKLSGKSSPSCSRSKEKNDDHSRKMETGTTANARENRRRPSCRKGKSKREIQINFAAYKSRNWIVHRT
jgi:hypothetical protein